MAHIAASYLVWYRIYPFGCGLSYTEFKYQDLNVDLTNINISSTEIIHFSLLVENIGKIDGDEVVQLYIKDVDAQDPENKKPYKALKTFKRVHVKAGKSEKVILPVKLKDLTSYNVKLKKWIVEPRKLDVLIEGKGKSRSIQLIFLQKLLDQFPILAKILLMFPIFQKLLDFW